MEPAIILAYRAGDGIMGGPKNDVHRKLVVLSGRAKGASFALTEARVDAGRESDNTICLKGRQVSRHHAVLVRTNGEYTLRDVSPRIGTFLNGRRTQEAVLKPGDRIRIGEFEMSYEKANGSVSDSTAAAMSAAPDDIDGLRQQLAAAQKEADEARDLAERTGSELTRVRAEAEKAGTECQERVASLTQEVDRLSGEMNDPKNSPETGAGSLSASAENVALAGRDEELRIKSSELEESRRLVHRLEADLDAAQVVIHKLSDQLAQARKASKLDEITQELTRLLETDPALRAGELGEFETALAETKAEWDKISELHSQVEQLAIENRNLRISAASAQKEAVLAKRCLSDQTNEEFTRIRQTLAAKRDEKVEQRRRFLSPFGFSLRRERKP